MMPCCTSIKTKAGGRWSPITDTLHVFTDLHTAIDETVSRSSGDSARVRIASGTYYTNGRSFSMAHNLTITGGYAGTETGTAPVLGPDATVLDGRNTHRVSYNENLDDTAVLQNSRAKESRPSGAQGGSINNNIASPTFFKCVFDSKFAVDAGNQGRDGGMYNNGGPAMYSYVTTTRKTAAICIPSKVI